MEKEKSCIYKKHFFSKAKDVTLPLLGIKDVANILHKTKKTTASHVINSNYTENTDTSATGNNWWIVWQLQSAALTMGWPPWGYPGWLSLYRGRRWGFSGRSWTGGFSGLWTKKDISFHWDDPLGMSLFSCFGHRLYFKALHPHTFSHCLLSKFHTFQCCDHCCDCESAADERCSQISPH